MTEQNAITGQHPVYYEKFYQRIWRPAMAFVYMVMNIFDYIIRPLINFYYISSKDITLLMLQVKELDPAVQLKFLEVISSGAVIPPVLPEFVHLAFGAILGVAAYSRYYEKKAIMGNTRKQ